MVTCQQLGKKGIPEGGTTRLGAAALCRGEAAMTSFGTQFTP